LDNYKLEGISMERLMTFLTAIGLDVDIVVRPRREGQETGMVSVVAS
jgi:hypothetical protein